ncbi:MAG: hypothetical protein RE472_05620 [Thermoplasmatales archaeon]|nr:MAG: hypothetical protein RE472_05620 [Thermoplasmatales archaeon]HIH61030.1 hypothetical protein [Ferroplasma sp.]
MNFQFSSRIPYQHLTLHKAAYQEILFFTVLSANPPSSKFVIEAFREKVINDKKKEIVEKAGKLKKYYEIDEDLTSLNSMDSEDFVN